MKLDKRALIKITGILFIISGAAMLLPAIVGLIYGEKGSVLALLLVMLVSIAVGGLFLLYIRFTRYKCSEKNNIKIRDAYFIVTLSWILMSSIAAFPYVIQGCIPSYIDAFFETCSGFTTTGASILTDIEALPMSMLFWRSFAHWIGGMGILVFAIALLPQLGISGQIIAMAETPGPSLSKTTPKMSDMARTLYIIYTGLTMAETLLLMVGGMNFFDALTHSFSTVGTGGFSNYNASIAYFQSPFIEGIIILFMALSGVNFGLYFFLLQGNSRNVWRDSELRTYITIIAGFTAIISIYLWLSGTYDSIFLAFRKAIFQCVSIITTTGFATADFDLWPTFCIMALLCLFFVGGCSSSTGGGIKVVRVLVTLKMIKRTALLRLHPNALIPLKLNNRAVPGDTSQGISSFIFLYIAVIFGVSSLISLDNFDFETCFTAAATCLGNIGPGLHEVGPTSNFSFFSDPSKLLLSFTMIAGRLELFTFFMLFSKKFWNPSH